MNAKTFNEDEINRDNFGRFASNESPEATGGPSALAPLSEPLTPTELAESIEPARISTYLREHLGIEATIGDLTVTKTQSGRTIITGNSEDIVEQTGIFQNALKSTSVEVSGTAAYFEETEQSAVSMRIILRYTSKSGGSNGQDLADIWVTEDGWQARRAGSDTLDQIDDPMKGWDEHPWSSDEIRDKYRKILETSATPEDAVDAMNVDYRDSVDREIMFEYGAKKFGVSYDRFYDYWLNT